MFSCCAVVGVLGGPALWNQLFRSRAEELYSGAADPFASRVVSQILLDAGLAGARAVVIPIQESAGQIAVVTLDEGDGFTGMGSASANEMTMMSVIQRMREDNRMEELGIERVAIDYRDENGQSLVAITASQTAIDMFAEGEINREEFMREINIGPGSFSYQEVLDLLQES
ncbi:MAG: hypothetical protein ACE5M4_03145 [Anaerolineales bacterium]